MITIRATVVCEGPDCHKRSRNGARESCTIHIEVPANNCLDVQLPDGWQRIYSPRHTWDPRCPACCKDAGK